MEEEVQTEESVESTAHAEMEDQEVETSEVEEEEIDEESPESESEEDEEEGEEPEPTVEERLAELESAKARDQKAINRKTAHIHSLQGANDKLKQELEALRQEQTKAPELTKPVIDDFDTLEDFQEADAEYRAEVKYRDKVKQEEATTKQQQNLAEAKAMQEAFTKQEHEFRTNNPSYDEARQEFSDYVEALQLSPAVEKAVIQQAHREGSVPAIINYFGEDGGARLDELEAISKLTPVEAAVEIHKIQQSLKAPVEKKETKPLPKPTKAKRPKASNTKDPNDNMSMDDWMRKRNKQSRR